MQPSPALGSWRGIAAHPGTGYLLFPPIWTAPVGKRRLEEHEGAFGVTAARKGSVREQRHRPEVRDIKDISRDVLSHNKWKGAVEPSSIAVLGNNLSTRNTSCPSLGMTGLSRKAVREELPHLE